MVERAIPAAVQVEQPVPRFEDFFEQERDRLFRAMTLLTKDPLDAEELVQEAFLKVWERWPRVASLAEPAAYLHRVGINAFLSKRRRLATAMRLPRRFRAEQRDDFADVEGRHAAIGVLQQLTPRERAAVVLIDVLDHPSGTAAELLGISPATVRQLASRGRARLRGRMVETDD